MSEKAGPELDRAVCEALGIARRWSQLNECGGEYAYPPVSTDWTAMRLVWEALVALGFYVCIHTCTGTHCTPEHEPSAVAYLVRDEECYQLHDTEGSVTHSMAPPEALCRAALAALSSGETGVTSKPNR